MSITWTLVDKTDPEYLEDKNLNKSDHFIYQEQEGYWVCASIPMSYNEAKYYFDLHKQTKRLRLVRRIVNHLTLDESNSSVQSETSGG